MMRHEPYFELRLATNQAEIEASQRLRYQVFVEELGADGPLVDHDARLERDRFDPFYDHLLLLDHRRAKGDQVIGVYRLMRAQGAERAGQFYSEGEYDLAPLRNSPRRVLELGRSCVQAEYRGGTAMMHLWSGLARYIAQHEIDVMFGVASFHGLDPAPWAGQLSLLHHNHLAPPDLRPRARADGHLAMDIVSVASLERPRAMRDMPALIKAYLRLGGFVGEGAFVDRDFNCIDVCLVVDVACMSPKHRALYTQGAVA